MVRYMKCPRCELNYIDADRQEYCDVCQKEMKGIPSDIDEIEDDDLDLATELCPICKENMIRPGEKMCEDCRRRLEYEDDVENPDDEDDEWREYLDDDTDADLDSEIGEIDETFDEEYDDAEVEEEFEEEEEEDLEYVTGDEIYSLADDDDDDDDSDGDDF